MAKERVEMGHGTSPWKTFYIAAGVPGDRIQDNEETTGRGQLLRKEIPGTFNLGDVQSLLPTLVIVL